MTTTLGTTVAPNLFGWADRPQEIKRRLQSPTLQKLHRILLRDCDQFLDETSPRYLDYQELGKAFWHERHGVFLVPVVLRHLATAFLTTGNTRYGEVARDILMTIIRRKLADAPSIGYGKRIPGWRHGPSHNKFLLGLGVWPAFELCFPLFSDGQVEEIAGYLAECAEISDQAREADYIHTINNRGARGLLATALFASCAAPFRDIPKLDEILTNGCIALEKYLFCAFDAKGAPYEGPMYASGLPGLALVAHMLRRQGRPNLLTHRTFERYSNYLVSELIPGIPSVNNLNDARLPCGSVAGCLSWMNHPSGAIIPWLAKKLDLHPDLLELHDPPSVFWQGAELDCKTFGENIAVRNFLNYLLWWDDSVPERSPEELGFALSSQYPIRGVASHRTGWSGKDLLLSHFCGRQEILLHRQGDFNHVALYALGEQFLVDAGYGTEMKMKEETDRWFGLTASHNCVLIDGMNQRGVSGSPGWAEGEMLAFADNAEGSFSLGDASGTTGPDHRVNRSLRHVFLDRAAPLPFALLIDENQKDGKPFAAEARWHTHFDNRLEPLAQGWLMRGRNADCLAKVWTPPPGEPAISFHVDHGRPQVRVKLTKALCRTVTLFLPLRQGVEAPAVDFTFQSDRKGTLAWQANGEIVYRREFHW